MKFAVLILTLIVQSVLALPMEKTSPIDKVLSRLVGTADKDAGEASKAGTSMAASKESREPAPMAPWPREGPARSHGPDVKREFDEDQSKST